MTPPPSRSWLPVPRPIAARFSAWLDLFRWLAAFAVCLAHLRAGTLVDYDAVAQPGWAARVVYFFPGFAHAAVMVFFVLSGYLVGGEVLRGLANGDFDWRHYIVRRLARLYTVYLAALVLGLLWDGIGLHCFNAGRLYTAPDAFVTLLDAPVAERLHPHILAGNLVFCQTLLVPPFGSNSPLWSLANEVWYYALFPLALWPLFGAGKTGGRVTALLLFAAGAWFVRGPVLLYLAIWLLGLVPHFLPRPLWRPAGPAGAFLLALLVDRFHLLAAATQFGRDLLVGITFAALLHALEHGKAAAPGPAGLHRGLAGCSYTLYLTHWPLALLAIAVLQQTRGGGYRMPFSPTAVAILVLLAAGVYGFSWALAQLTERRTPRVRAWLLALTAGLAGPPRPAALRRPR